MTTPDRNAGNFQRLLHQIKFTLAVLRKEFVPRLGEMGLLVGGFVPLSCPGRNILHVISSFLCSGFSATQKFLTLIRPKSLCKMTS